MQTPEKNTALAGAREHVLVTCGAIEDTLVDVQKRVIAGKENLKSLSSFDQVLANRLLSYTIKRAEELTTLEKSPYFVRCDVLFDDETKPRSLYFAKFLFDERDVYSWTAPVATLRFEDVGKEARYTLPSGEEKKGRLLRRDQFMIVDKNIIFMTTESETQARELVYQEHFSSRKQGFVLPEVVAQMEKAQDKVIRTHHLGPLAISGPAGSGKTTLALHRVAYLIQSPDTAHLYTPESILVFVQDAATQQYFAQLLPELGIRDVRITTFDQWVFDILNLPNTIRYQRHVGTNEHERDSYEYAKVTALQSGKTPAFSRHPFVFLQKLYEPFLDAAGRVAFEKQKKAGVLDRIDLTALLTAYNRSQGGLHKTREYFVRQKNSALKKKREKVSPDYSLMLVDEFQNFLPEQLLLFKQCIRKELQSIIYVGDMAQKIYFGTIQTWQEIGEALADERKIALEKVYRNTKSILRYIQSLGYAVQIPDGMTEGAPVQEVSVKNIVEELNYVQQLIKKASSDKGSDTKTPSIGILAKNASYLAPFQKALNGTPGLHIFTMEESQGVEFDIVCIVGMHKADWEVVPSHMPAAFDAEKQKILRDLLYIALTRAIAELHITTITI